MHWQMRPPRPTGALEKEFKMRFVLPALLIIVLLFGLGFVLTGCETYRTLPIEQPAPPCPTPEPTPAPTPKPIPVLIAPEFVVVGTPFSVTLCEPFQPNTRLYIDAFLLGTFGDLRNTGCMTLIVPGLNTTGVRTLKTGGHQSKITVLSGS